MNDTLHSFHPLSTDPTRGTHCFTTQSHDEALALSAARSLRRAVQTLTIQSGMILTSVEQSHGEGRITDAVRAAFADAEATLHRAGKGA